ncbi:hypothetical protein BOTCAL_1594g00010 [Botryotinia calthae]|uniref:ATPase AAA-type core domain-containing protein n=1 Tax=Botryotinia calthae TaxID=38488 RepID=A0A4Y8CC39_9HELO|nr:hypothetical protein BOTCAL_1594g00010 [Botryotinia calthae]
MIVFEDIKPSMFEDYKPESNKEGISLATFLNIFDGLISLEGSIINMTTNYFQELHDFCPELLREGRIDEAIKFTYIDEEQAKSMFYTYTSPDTELIELDFEFFDQGMEFGKLLDGMKVRYSVVQKYLFKWIKNSNGVFHYAKEWLDNMLTENSDKIKTQISEISHGFTMIDDIKILEETGKLYDSVVVDRSKLATNDKEVDESRIADNVEMVDESKSLSDGIVGSESRLVDDIKMAGEIKVEDVVIIKTKWWMNSSQWIRSRKNTNR